MIRIENLDFRYRHGDFALRVPALEVARGEAVAVVGPSGSGKTTLLHLVAGIAAPQRGRVEVDGTDVAALSDAARRDFRIARVGLVFQAFELLEYLSVLDNILLPFRISGALRLDGDANKLRRLTTRLSQGERQRVAVCRALVARPKLLLADEPTGNLDPSNTGRVLDSLFECAEEAEATVLTVTHERELLDRFDRTIDFRDFRSGLPEKIAEAGEVIS
jgi:putative ABC transport system ATP-binding protein